MSIVVSSASMGYGNYFKVSVDGQEVNIEGERGIGFVIVEKGTRKITYARMFDTYLDPNESSKLNSILYQTKPGDLLILGVKDEGSRSLNLDLIQTLTSFGSKYINQLGYRDSWAFVVRKGKPQSAREIKESNQAVELTLKRKKNLRHVVVTSSSFEHGNSFSLTINDNANNFVNYSEESQRGIVMVVVNKEGKVILNQIYDTYLTPASSDQLESAIQSQISLSVGNLIILGVKDEGSRSLTPSLRRVITSLGSQQINQLGHRDSWCFVARIGKPQSAKELRESNRSVSLSWVPKKNRMNPPPHRYNIHYCPPNLSNFPSNIEHSPDDLYHHPHPNQPIPDPQIHPVHHRSPEIGGAGVDIGANVRNNRARRRDTIS